ncbi:MAG: hypothetical protein Q8L78_05270 [Coxiellaceae bacterium]|nr:hypothetical protein [Coxiellaceae bacterium]
MKNFKNKLLVLLEKFRRAYRLSKFLQQTPCRLEEIDLKNNKVIIHCYVSRTEMNLSTKDAISEAKLINSLPSLQACWLGYYYGKSLREGKMSNKKFSKHENKHLLLRSSKKRYSIVGLEHRNFMIAYIDLKTRIEHTKPAIELAQDNYFLENIGPSQACYIGIWSGIAVAKHGSGILHNEEPQRIAPYLRVVK